MTEMRRQDEAPAPGPVDAPRTPAPLGPVDAPATPPPPAPADDRPTYETGGLRLGLLIASVVALGLWQGWPTLVMVFGIVVTIFLHELGHYVTAKWSGMKVTEFFIGFGPKIWSFQRGETEYGFKVIPAGAYVRIVGMNNLDESDPADEARTYRAQSFPKRLLVVSAGSLSHLLQAFVIGIVLLGVVGIPGGSITDPRPEAWTIDNVEDDSAAQAAGLQDGDRIVEVGGRPASDYTELSDALSTYDVGDEVAITIVRNGDERTLDATLQPRPESAGGDTGSPFLGVGTSPEYEVERVGIVSAIAQTPGEMWHVTSASVGALGRIFSPSGLSNLADDVGNARNDQPQRSGGGTEASDNNGRDPNGLISILGIIQIGSHEVEHRAAFMLVLFFQINLLLGLFNMLPLPPLDGGHAAVAIYERARSRRGQRYHADFGKLLPLTYAVFLILVVVGVTTLYLDAVNPIEL
jgi:membrane-associated protease RseP (regulator of RpoE activity)